MICTLLRAVRCTERLHGCPGKPWFLPHSVPHRACSQTEPRWRWGLQEQNTAARPRYIWGVNQRSIWTQGRSPQSAKEDGSKQVSVHRSQGGETVLSTSQKGGLFYTIFRELFSSSSPNKIYGKALEKCRSHPEVISVFGEPVKGYGEATRRGRRQHVSFIEYTKDGLKHMRVKFYIQGSEPGKQGTVHLEVKENPESGEYEFRYIFVELEPYSRTIVIEDNRS
uniref:Translocase of inner mitochondrial membrane 21 n=1 Tax=Ovis aries TaxID=9940 RepID=A0AC11BZZ6_SHEEP